MGINIIITEKPSVARTYASVLGISLESSDNGYVNGFAQKSVLKGKEVYITWAFGHLIRIGQPIEHNEEWKEWNVLPMLPTNFKFFPDEKTIKQFNAIKKLYTRTDVESIYYAGDSGREGIYIQALIRNQIFQNPPTSINEKVVWISSFSDEAILEGIETAKSINQYQPMIDSGYCRAKTDWLIGLNFTRAVTTSCGSNTLVRVGRVLTPTLAMLLQRQIECENYVETVTYGIKAKNFASWKADENSRFFESPLLNTENSFTKRENAIELQKEFSKDMTLKVESVKPTRKTIYAPQLFNLTDLQALGSKKFKISPDKTLAVIQKLYESKYVTYPRTNSRHLDTKEADKLKSCGFDFYQYNVQEKKSKKFRYVDDSEVDDHFAVIPLVSTNENPCIKSIDNLTDELEKKFYQEILVRFYTAMKPPMIYDSYKVIYVHSNGEHFYGNFKVTIDKGWKEYETEQKSDEIELSEEDIPITNTIIPVPEYTINEIKSQPPVMYTTGTIIVAMEKAGSVIDEKELALMLKGTGIGTPATRADIIKNLAKKDKNGFSLIDIDANQKITVTEFGKKVLEIIKFYDEDLTSPIKTAEMETKLHNVETNIMQEEKYMNEINEYVKKTVEKILTNNHVTFNLSKNGKSYECPCCNKKLNFNSYGFFCDTKQDGCGFCFFSKIGSKDLTNQMESLMQEIIDNGKTKLVKGLKSNSGKSFDAFFTLNKEKKKIELELEKLNVSDKVYDCPCCFKPLSVGKLGYYCNPKTEGCGFGLQSNICNKDISKDIEKYLNQVITNGKTDLITGFKSSSGKNFDAFLVLNKEEKKLKLEFEKIKLSERNCPCCNKVMGIDNFGYNCNLQDGCGFRFALQFCKKNLTNDIDKYYTQIVTNGKTELIKGFTSNSGKKFDAFLVLDKESKKLKFQFSDTPKIETNGKSYNCPCCNNTLTTDNYGYVCNCGFKFSLTICGKNISDGFDKYYNQLVTNGKTELIQGMKSKSGKTFNAYLVLNKEQKKCSFEFPNNK